MKPIDCSFQQYLTSTPYNSQDPRQVYQSPQQTFQTPTIQTQFIHQTFFFYRPPNYLYHYKVNCEEINYKNVACLLNKSLNNGREYGIQFHEDEHVFYYHQQYDNRLYRVTCELVSLTAINNYLNENICGIKLQQTMDQEELSFVIEQKQNLEFHLTQYLSNHLLN